MVIYGIRSSSRGTFDMPGKCVSCGSEHTTEPHMEQRYAHVFWVPLFPVGKRGSTFCHHCKLARASKDLDPQTRLLVNDLKKEVRTPVWMYSGLLILGLLIPLAFWQSARHGEKMRAYLSAPAVGDVYDIDLTPGGYTVYKVTAVRNDSAGVAMSTYETDRSRGLYSLRTKGDEAYDEERVWFSKADLLRMHEDGVIIAVKR